MVEIYQIKVWVRKISPIIYRKILIPDTFSLAELHHTLQIIIGWPDIGSRTIELVAIKEQKIIETRQANTGFDPITQAKGVLAFLQTAGTILDIGGQDSKAIALNENGRVKKFEMNDRCATGTGKFLKIMAKNPCIRKLISQKLGREVFTPERPQMIGALGAALILKEKIHINN